MQNHSEKRKGKSVKRSRAVARKSADDLDVLYAKFKEIKQAEGRSERTLGQYDENYGFFTSFLDLHGIERKVSTIDKDIIRKYIVYMRDDWVKFDGHKYKTEEYMTKGLAPSTINTRLKTLRVMFKCLVEEEYVTNNPMIGVKNITEPDGIINVLSAEELKQLLAAPNQRDYTQFRDYVLMYFLVESMCRIGETLSLRKQDFDFYNKTVTIPAGIAKSRKARTLPLGQTMIRLIKELIAENNTDFDSEYIFLSNYGEPLKSNHFRKRLNEYAKMACIDKNVHPHLIRHSAATIFLESGGDIRHLQLLLGHADLRVVIRYTHLSQQSLRNQHDKYSALNQVTGKLNKPRKIKR